MREIECVSLKKIGEGGGSFSLSVCTFYRLYLFIYLFFSQKRKNVCVRVCVCLSDLLVHSKS